MNKEPVKLTKSPFKPRKEFVEKVIENTEKIVTDLKLNHDLPPFRPEGGYVIDRLMKRYPDKDFALIGFPKENSVDKEATLEYCDKMMFQMKQLVNILDNATSVKNATQVACLRGIRLICDDLEKAINGE